jgi:crescentin
MTFWRWPFKDGRVLAQPHQLNQIGLRNELLRNQIEEIEHGLRQVDSFRESFKGIVIPISGVLEELEKTRSQLEETEAKLTVATESLAKLNSKYFALSTEFESARGQADLLSQERSDLERRLRLVEFALEERSSAAEQTAHELDATRAQLQSEIRKTEEVAAELQAVKSDLDEKYRAAAHFEQALIIATDRNSLLTQEVDSLMMATEGHIEQITRHLRRESDLEAELEHAQGQITDLKSAHAQGEVAQGMARLRNEEVVNRLTAENASVAGQLHALEDRATTMERLLDEARQQLGCKVSEARGLELKLHEQSTRVAALEKKLASLQGDLSDAEAKLSQSEGARQALIERSRTLVKTLEAKSISLEKAESRVQYLNARLEEFAQKLQDQRSQSELQILRLTQELEKERSERVFAEGALQASRRARHHAAADPTVENKSRDDDALRPDLEEIPRQIEDDRAPGLELRAPERPAMEQKAGIHASGQEANPRRTLDLNAKAS